MLDPKNKRLIEDAAKRRGIALSQDTVDIERFINEGGSTYDYLEPGVIMANCQYGYHIWKWYEGFHMERYWFCTTCDEKDYRRDPPKKP